MGDVGKKGGKVYIVSDQTIHSNNAIPLVVALIGQI